jgi:hypothetical protein
MAIYWDLSNGIERMQILPIRDFALCMTQEDFKVDVDVTVPPMQANVV